MELVVYVAVYPWLSFCGDLSYLATSWVVSKVFDRILIKFPFIV